jgi:hypothetical protein
VPLNKRILMLTKEKKRCLTSNHVKAVLKNVKTAQKLVKLLAKIAFQNVKSA